MKAVFIEIVLKWCDLQLYKLNPVILRIAVNITITECWCCRMVGRLTQLSRAHRYERTRRMWEECSFLMPTTASYRKRQYTITAANLFLYLIAAVIKHELRAGKLSGKTLNLIRQDFWAMLYCSMRLLCLSVILMMLCKIGSRVKMQNIYAVCVPVI